MTTRYDLTLYAGETRVVEVTVTDETGAVVNLTAATVVYKANFPTPLSKSVDSGITLTTPASGVFEIAFIADDTHHIDSRTSVEHECKVTTATGDTAVAFTGHLAVYNSLHDPA